MDEKDPKDEELNPQGQDDINEADDSFGLPDLDYKPLDEASEESDEELGTENTDPVEVESEEVEDSDGTEKVEEEPYNYESEGQEEEEEKPELRYQIEEKSSNAPKILLGILAVIIIAAGVWYMGYYRPQQQEIADAEKAKQEQIAADKAAEAAVLKAERDKAAAAAAEEARLAAEAEELAKAGVQILTERSGRYYIILESFIDGDFAKDFGNKIAKEGTPSFLIPPYSKKKMQRVGIGSYDSHGEAQSALNDLPSEFGTGKWILKY